MPRGGLRGPEEEKGSTAARPGWHRDRVRYCPLADDTTWSERAQLARRYRTGSVLSTCRAAAACEERYATGTRVSDHGRWVLLLVTLVSPEVVSNCSWVSVSVALHLHCLAQRA